MSLVNTPASELATCAACAGTRVTTIRMTLTDGSLVDFASCHTCEHKSWTQDDRDLDITTVLAKAKKEKVVR